MAKGGDVDYMLRKKSKTDAQQPPHSPSLFYNLRNLAPAQLEGFIVPWSKVVNPFLETEYKLIARSGQEYFLVSNERWTNTLKFLCWSQVRLEGRLNPHYSFFYPDKVLEVSSSSARTINLGA